MKTRFVFSAFCMLVAMTMATGAFAQGIFIVSSGPEARGRANGQAELSGGISVTMTAGTFTVDHSGTVVIDYGVPITNAVGPAGDDVAGNNINVNICTAAAPRSCRRRRCGKSRDNVTRQDDAHSSCGCSGMCSEHIDQRGQRAARPGGIGAIEHRCLSEHHRTHSGRGHRPGHGHQRRRG